MGFTNFGNFGRKISEFNAERREKNMEKLRVKAKSADDENIRLQEELALRKSINKNAKLKKQVDEQKNSTVKELLKKVNKSGKKYEKKDKENKFDILGNNSEKKLPQMFGGGGNGGFKF